MTRNANSEVYLEIEGTHPKQSKQFESVGARPNHSLQNDDIEGSKAYSRTWLFNVDRRKEEGMLRSCYLEQQEYAESLAKGILAEKLKGRMDGKMFKELHDIFNQLDREKSGKLTAKEVGTALKKLEIELNSTELKHLATAFDSAIDGFIDYQKLLQASTCTVPKKHFKPNGQSSHIISLCLNEWVDRLPWPSASMKSSSCLGSKVYNEPKDMDMKEEDINERVPDPIPECVKSCSDRETQRTGGTKMLDKAKLDETLLGESSPPSNSLNTEQIQLGLRFRPDENSVQGPHVPQPYFSLPHDFREPPYNQSKPLPDARKTWEKKVGGTLFTGEGNSVSHTSYVTGYDWSRPSTARTQAKKRRVSRPQSLPNFCFFPEAEWQDQPCISSARSESSSKPPMDSKHPTRPMSASLAQGSRRLLSGITKATHFSSPRSVLLSPASSRSSWSPRCGMFCLEGTPRARDLFGGSFSARETLANKSHPERLPQKLQSLRKEDAAAVRALF